MGRLTGKTLLLLSLMAVGCQKSSEEAAVTAAVKTLYAATGACNAGFGSAAMVTYSASAATRSIERFNTSTGANLGYLMDFTASNFVPNNNPNFLIDDGEDLFVLIDNSTAGTTSERAIWRVPKTDPFNFIKYASSASALATSVVRGMVRDSEGSFLVGVSNKIEKMNGVPNRVTAGGNPWVNNPGGACTPAANSMTAVAMLAPLAPATTGKLLFAHQSIAASTLTTQRIAAINANGYFGATDCAGGVQINSVTHTATPSSSAGPITFSTAGTSPTSMVYIPMPAGSSVTGKLVVTYSNNARANSDAGTYRLNHGIAIWDVTETSATAVTINNPFLLYDNTSVVYAPSAVTFDPLDNSLYVAVAGEPGAASPLSTNNVPYNIEKFTLDYTSTTPSVTRIHTNNQPFIKGGTNLKCVSSLLVAD